MLGGLAVDGVDQRALGSRKARLLLGVLTVAGGHVCSADALAEILWADDPPQRPTEQIGVLVSRLRRALGGDRIVRTDAGYRLVAHWCDLDELIARAQEATAALDDSRAGAARAAAESALALGAAEVLPGEDGEWLEVPRARADAAVTTARRVAVEAALEGGDLSAAIAHAEALLAVDPLDEVVTRCLMLAQLRSGRPAAALASYARLRHALVEELGVAPSAPVEALHTAILSGEPGAGVPEPIAGEARFAGRRTELATLDHHLAAVSSSPIAVIVEGEPGVGKTSLLEAWIAQLDVRSVSVLRGRCDPLGRDLPLQPVADALHEVVRAHPEVLDAVDHGTRVVLAARLGVGPVVEQTDPSPGVGAAQLFAAIERLVAAVAGGRPTALVIDDLHHADASTVACLASLTRRGTRTLVVGARQPGTVALPDAVVVRLGPLDVDAVATLVGPDRAEDLHQRSGGHPLLLRAMADAEPGTLPTTLHEALGRQVTALGDAATTVQHAAVLGPDIDLDLVASVERLPAGVVLERLERAVGVGLVVDAPGGFRFRHELLRQGLEAAVTTARRALVHREAARRLADRRAPEWASVAFHAQAGGDEDLAIEAYGSAASTAARRFDPAAAESYLDAAIDLRPDAGLFVDRARVRMSRRSFETAGEDARTAIALEGGAPALEIAAWVSYYRRHYDEARSLADQAIESAPDAAVRSSALAVAGRVRHGAGDLPGALALLEEPVDAPPVVRGVADVWHAHALVHAGEAATALRLADRALAVGDGLAQPFAPLHGRFARVMALGQLGRPAAALVACDDLDAAVARFGEQGARFLGPADNVRAWVLRNLGRHEEADEANVRARDATGADGTPQDASLAEGFWVAMLDLADGALLRGALDEAADLVERCEPVERWDGTMAWHQRHRLGLLRARLALATDRSADAAASAQAVFEDARGRHAGRYECLAGAVIAAADPEIDPSAVVDQLPRVAGLEAWRYVAAIAAARDDDGLRRHAARSAAALIAAAGTEPHHLEALAERLLR